ncbi:hypothetical protein [Vibrio variabilis]|uniref:hypothetical protein n=1 Tax=Vibrio variabilis TaxID=990271 RepID=UPI0013A6C3AE|nr:hypothetical protein [Vibrio variabilis]
MLYTMSVMEVGRNCSVADAMQRVQRATGMTKTEIVQRVTVGVTVAFKTVVIFANHYKLETVALVSA